jgi:cytochrome c5
VKIEKAFLTIALLAAMLVQTVSASTIEDEITARIKKAGSVCLQGDDCGQATAGIATAANATGGADAIYKASCSTCHSIGVAGAPKLGNKDDWAPRISKGMDALYASIFNGIAPGMPARGLCFTCSDDDLKAVVDLMVEQSK